MWVWFLILPWIQALHRTRGDPYSPTEPTSPNPRGLAEEPDLYVRRTFITTKWGAVSDAKEDPRAGGTEWNGVYQGGRS